MAAIRRRRLRGALKAPGWWLRVPSKGGALGRAWALLLAKASPGLDFTSRQLGGLERAWSLATPSLFPSQAGCPGDTVDVAGSKTDPGRGLRKRMCFWGGQEMTGHAGR